MLKNVYEGKTLLVSGPYNLILKEGTFEILGTIAEKDERITVPENKRLAINVVKTGKIEMRNDYPAGVKEANDNPIPLSWEKLVEKILKNKINTVLVIGAANTGKSTLITYLSNKLIQHYKSVSAIDSDLGQSDIGPAGTIGLSVIEKKTYDLSENKVYKQHFVGSFSPSMSIVEILIGLKKLTASALANSEALIVNTSGLIDGDTGRLLKESKIDVLNPDIIVLIQKNNECEHLVKNLTGRKIFRVSVSNFVRTKTYEERKLNRKISLGKYLSNAQTVKLSLKKIKLKRCFFTSGTAEPIPENYANQISYIEKLGLNEGAFIITKKKIEKEKLADLKKKYNSLKIMVSGEESGLFAGLMNESNDYIGIGILEKIDIVRDNLYIKTCVDAQLIKSITLGLVKLDSEGNETGYVEPGTI